MHPLTDVRIEVVERQDGIRLARTAGDLDMRSAPVLRDCLNRRIGAENRFVLDFDEVTFLGSAGLEVLVEASERTVPWALVAHQRSVVRPLQVTGLAARLPMQPNVPAAILRLSAVTS